MSKKTIIKGTLILTIAGLLTKILGFYNRIFLTRLIGVVELGKYQLVFPIYMFVFACCSQGISTTLTKQTSYYIGKGNKEKADYIFKLSIIISTILSIILAMIIYINSDLISYKLLKNTDCGTLLRIITIAMPFVAIKSCINFYFIGIDKPGYHGFSHLIEQIIRISAAYILSLFVMDDKVNAVLAVIAVVIGEVSATVISIVLYYVNKPKANNTSFYKKIKHNLQNNRKLTNPISDDINNQKSKNKTEKKPLTPKEKRDVFHYFKNDAIPITINNLIFTLFSTLEAIIMPAMLFYYYNDSDIALEMFGIVTGIVIPFILFPATITTSLSTMLLPAISYANARKDVNAINKALKNCIVFCILLGILASAGFYILGMPMCEFAFKSREAGILLKKLCLLCPLIYTSGNLTSILNGIDKSFFTLICNIIGISIRICFIFLMVPTYGLNAYAMGMFTSYTVINLLMLFGIKQIITSRQTIR
ncbi:MAG: oligosaccharide flippase family protein [Lachnospiraceae bacterium]|nr:oligosaccharide flippase family protein [Lachnospiraceae bacterium]